MFYCLVKPFFIVCLVEIQIRAFIVCLVDIQIHPTIKMVFVVFPILVYICHISSKTI